MTTEFDRAFSLERGVVNMDTGEFPMIAASEGEASDGHILSIDGLDMPARQPMLFGHQSTPEIPSLGSIVSPTKSRDGEGVPIQRAVGRFNLDGDDPLAGVRRGIAQLVADGDLPAVSIRWSGEGVPRSGLPEGHPHRVATDASGPSRFGMLFEKSRSLEVSVVAIGADVKALAGRSQSSTDRYERTFFRVLAEMQRDDMEMSALAPALHAVTEAQSQLTNAGIDYAGLIRLMDADDSEPLVRVSYGDDQSAWVPAGVVERLTSQSNEMMREAFELACSRVSVETPAPVEVETPAAIVPLETKVRKKGTVDAMSPSQFAEGLRQELARTVYSKTGRK